MARKALWQPRRPAQLYEGCSNAGGTAAAAAATAKDQDYSGIGGARHGYFAGETGTRRII